MEERLNLFVDASLKEELQSFARARGTTVSAVLREAAADYLSRHTPEPDDLTSLFATYDGSSDASTTIDEALYGRRKRA